MPDPSRLNTSCRRSLRFAVALAIAAALFAACGQPEPETATVEGQDRGSGAAEVEAGQGQLVLAAVVSETEANSTGRFDGNITLAVDSLSDGDGGVGNNLDELVVDIEGSFDLANEAAELTVDVSNLAPLLESSTAADGGDQFAMPFGAFGVFDDPIRLVMVDGRSFIQWPFISALFSAFAADEVAPGNGDPSALWIEGTADDLTGAAGGFGLDGIDHLPTDLLDELREADADIEEIGPDTVRGTATTRYRATIDHKTNADADDHATFDGQQSVDVWVDDQGRARKLRTEIDAEDIEDIDDMGEGTIGAGVSSIIVDFELYDLGNTIAIEPPPQDSTLSADELMGGGSFGEQFDA